MLQNYAWPASSPDGGINVASMLDIQAFFVQEGLSLRNLPPEKLLTETYIEHANRTLGPFVLANKASTLAGCR